MEIGKRIQKIRKTNKESQEYLANLLEKSKSGISAMENENRQITLKDIITICEHYNVSADYLIFGKEDVREEELSEQGKQLLQEYKRYLKEHHPAEIRKIGNL